MEERLLQNDGMFSVPAIEELRNVAVLDDLPRVDAGSGAKVVGPVTPAHFGPVEVRELRAALGLQGQEAAGRDGLAPKVLVHILH